MAKSNTGKGSNPAVVEGVALEPALVGVQLAAEGREPEPRVALLRPPTEQGADHPPTPPMASPSPAPRFVHQNERAPAGLQRFKIRCTNYGDQPTRYVLARDEAEARAHYLKGTGLNAVIARLERDGVEYATPLLVVRPQPD